MGAPDLIFELRRKGYSIRADGNYLDISPADLPPEVVQTIRQSKAEILAELQREARRQKVIAMLDGKRFALFADDDKTDPVIATVGIREVATFELAIPRHSYDGMVLLELIEKHYGEHYANT